MLEIENINRDIESEKKSQATGISLMETKDALGKYYVARHSSI
jgi:hypothetical protein